jgi:endonuclease-3
MGQLRFDCAVAALCRIPCYAGYESSAIPATPKDKEPLMNRIRKTPIPKAVLQEGTLPAGTDMHAYALEIMQRLEQHYPGSPPPALDYSNPYECVVSAIISEGARDVVTNRVTPELYAKYPDFETLSDANPADVEALIHPLRWYHTKTRYLIETAQIIIRDYGGRIPQTIDELTRLPGVSMKTANLIASDCLGHTLGFSVDTHVFMVSHRLGLSHAKTKYRTEEDLNELFPQEHWYRVNFEMIELGKQICHARNPQHEECFLNDICPYYLSTLESG